MAVLDSSTIIHLLKGTQQGHILREKFENEILTTTSISINEVLIGIKDQQKILALEFLKELEILPFDERAAYKSVELEDYFRKKGKLIGKLDTMIAAICLTHNLSLITTDKDFDFVPGLKVLTA